MTNGFVQQQTEEVDVDPPTDITPTPPVEPSTPPVNFDSGFVQASPPPAEGTQTFGTSTPTATQTFMPSPVPTISDTSSLAPVGSGRSATSTVPSIRISDVDSDINLGGIAAGGVGVAGLAALLGSQGREENGGIGGMLSPDNILSGAKKIYDLADMGDMDILAKLKDLLPEDMVKVLDDFTSIPEKLFDTISEAFGGGTGVNTGGIGQGGLTQAGTLVEMGGIGPGFGTAGSVAGSVAPGALSGTLPTTFGPSLAGTGLLPATGPTLATQMGGMPATATAAMGFGTPAGAAVAYGGGPMLGATTLAPQAGGFAALGAAGPLALAGLAFGAMQMLKSPDDPTEDSRMMNQVENIMQGGGGGIPSLEQSIYQDPRLLNLIKQVTDGKSAAPFGTKHTSGGTQLISWAPSVAKKVNDNMARLEKAASAGQGARNVGPGEVGLHGVLPPYAHDGVVPRFNAYNDPFGTREAEARRGGEWGDQPKYAGSGRDLSALIDLSGPGDGDAGGTW